MPTSEQEVLDYHLNYECEMLYNTHLVLLTATELSQLSANVLIESFCVHARCLFEFFQSAQRDYTGQSYPAFPGLSSMRKDQILVKINSQISHLYYRDKKSNRTYDPREVINAADRIEMYDVLYVAEGEFYQKLKPSLNASGRFPMQPIGSLVSPSPLTTTQAPTRPSATNAIQSSSGQGGPSPGPTPPIFKLS